MIGIKNKSVRCDYRDTTETEAAAIVESLTA